MPNLPAPTARAPLARIVGAVLVLLALGGCHFEFTSPLSDPDAAERDNRLAGAWVAALGNADSDKRIYLHFLREDAGAMYVQVVIHGDGDMGVRDSIALFVMFPSLIDGHRFMNLKRLARDDRLEAGPDTTPLGAQLAGIGSDYALVRYKIGPDGVLHVWGESQVLKDDVRDGLLAGEVVSKGGHLDDNLRVFANTAKLVDYLRARGPETTFGDDMPEFRRIN